MFFPPKYIEDLLKKIDLLDLMTSHNIRTKTGVGKNDYYEASFCCGKTDLQNGRIRKGDTIYRCRACGDFGNAINFLERVAGMDFQDAVHSLVEMANIDLPVVDPVLVEAEKRKNKAMLLAAEFYHSQKNCEYLLSRGINEAVLNRHKVGYAPGGRALRGYLEEQGYTKEELQSYRLINAKGLDALFYRAVVPVYMYGKVTDLYGRAVDDSKAGIKHFYVNGDDILGGFDLLDTKRVVYLYESAIDRLVAESYDISNGIDSGGAHKFKAAHARMLKKKKVKRVMVIYDGDKAGRQGAMASGQLLVDEGIEVWIGELPDGMDPAQMIQEKGKDAFVAALYKPKTFQQYKMYDELSKYRLEDIEKYIADKKTLTLVAQ
ncbi:toprim domain-containing protein [Bacillus sp. FJAT-28004]|uniref:toprim domain-containing protein n=1 Tax=Bacillus sp. FJAT-28004 TaxID=1679165 RepID=UPI0006B65F2B|nr:toprim domain-containing protein [Bacillus sp. FJAT-28004]